MEMGICADPVFFSQFSFPLLSGAPHEVLSDPNNIVISESLASKYFNHTDPIGKPITVSDGFNRMELKVSGVMANVPANSTLKFEYVISFTKLLDIYQWAENWGSSSFMTVVQLNPQTNLNDLNRKIEPFYTDHHVSGDYILFLNCWVTL